MTEYLQLLRSQEQKKKEEEEVIKNTGGNEGNVPGGTCRKDKEMLRHVGVYCPSIQEAEVPGSHIQGQSWLHSRFYSSIHSHVSERGKKTWACPSQLRHTLVN